MNTLVKAHLKVKRKKRVKTDDRLVQISLKGGWLPEIFSENPSLDPFSDQNMWFQCFISDQAKESIGRLRYRRLSMFRNGSSCKTIQNSKPWIFKSWISKSWISRIFGKLNFEFANLEFPNLGSQSFEFPNLEFSKFCRPNIECFAILAVKVLNFQILDFQYLDFQI